MIYSIQDIATIISAKEKALLPRHIKYLAIDSRKIVFPKETLFFAITTERNDGHDFIKDLIEKGVENFVVHESFNTTSFPKINFLAVENVTAALQTLAKYHRTVFLKLPDGNVFPVIGITGSNGKTIVKEWLYELLNNSYHIVRSPRSYNSQLGVPLSVWQINEQHNLAIFEAGISTVNEMDSLESIIQPTIGVLTNIGEAHREGFSSNKEKLLEKLKLFKHASQVIAPLDCIGESEQQLLNQHCSLVFTWSRNHQANLRITKERIEQNNTSITAQLNGLPETIVIPFADRVSIDNAITCWCVMIVLGFSQESIQQRMLLLEPVEMRMQLKSGINQCFLINDSYSNDLLSFSMGLAYLKQQAAEQKTTIILSDILQAGIPDEFIYQQVANELKQRKIHRLIGIGQKINQHQAVLKNAVAEFLFFPTTTAFLQAAMSHWFNREYILLKGARVFEFERISKWLAQQQHQTAMEINLSAMVYNLKAYQKKLAPTTMVMAMVKAFSYGSGSIEIARLLEFHKVNYLAVAYADEGVALRKAGIGLPIMVMSPDEQSFDDLINYHLEPELFSFPIYDAFHQYLLKQAVSDFPIHIKLNTGMNRLGFELADVPNIASSIIEHQSMQVISVFSHLVASESNAFDDFTLEQANDFSNACKQFEEILGYTFIKHISNTAAIFRYPTLQYNMVRLGIGLYGVDSANAKELQLQTVATLKSTIAQIRTVTAGDTVGYGRNGLIQQTTQIATVRIGYADGFNRRLGNGRASMYVHGQLAPVVGNVCMDMTMIDVTGIPNLKEGDTVEVFGANLPVQQVAEWSDTIVYEILTGISQRVKRVYLEE